MKSLKRKIKLLFLSLIIFLVVYLTIFGNNGILKIRQIEQETKRVQQASENLKTENEKLKKEINLLQQDDKYIEKIAREELGMVQPDEIIVKKAKTK